VVSFQDALANFLACINNPGVSTYTICQQAEDMLIPFCAVPVFHVIKFTKHRHSGESEISDSVHAWPEVVDLYTRTTPARFDTVIIHQDSPQDQGNKGTSNDLFSKLEVWLLLLHRGAHHSGSSGVPDPKKSHRWCGSFIGHLTSPGLYQVVLTTYISWPQT